ncbi:hypothetical protein LBMAG42_25950 [Deltaproteobacteria bacterium]|nr:hypothetical protein LBMAG42_25950 [Deltaproteobacteria bacterium]
MLPRLPLEDSALDLLRACHTKMRLFTTALERIVESYAKNPADLQIPDAARITARYFREALPKHAEDEDLSITPRLLAVYPELAPGLANGAREHAVVEGELPQLTAALDKLAACERLTVEEFSSFSARVDRVVLLLRTHALTEETTWFTPFGQLPAEDQRAVRLEMAERRARPGAP